MSSTKPTPLRIETLKLVQNILADSLPTEIGSVLEAMGEQQVLPIIVDAAKGDQSGGQISDPEQFLDLQEAVGSLRYTTDRV